MEMTRFVITMDRAVNLICQAIKHIKGGETFVWKMETLKIIDLANSMINRYANGKTAEIIITGKEEGEKIHEEIMSQEELLRSLEMDNLYIIFPMADYAGAKNKYQNARSVENPVIASNMGFHMSQDEINKLLENYDGSFIN